MFTRIYLVLIYAQLSLVTWIFFSLTVDEYTAPFECMSVLSELSLSSLCEVVMDREVWRAVVHGVTKSQTRLSDWTELDCMYENINMTWSVFSSSPSSSFFSFLVSFLKNFCGSYDYPPQYSCLGISWIEEPGKLESIGSQKIRHVWVTKTFLVFSILYSYRNFYHLFFSFVSESICIFLVKIWST